MCILISTNQLSKTLALQRCHTLWRFPNENYKTARYICVTAFVLASPNTSICLLILIISYLLGFQSHFSDKFFKRQNFQQGRTRQEFRPAAHHRNHIKRSKELWCTQLANSADSCIFLPRWVSWTQNSVILQGGSILLCLC